MQFSAYLPIYLVSDALSAALKAIIRPNAVHGVMRRIAYRYRWQWEILIERFFRGAPRRTDTSVRARTHAWSR